MGHKSPYPEEFRRHAVALYRATAGKRTYAAVAADLGITAESLRTWVRKDEGQAVPGRRDVGGSEAEELARLRTENARLLKAEKEWQLEHEILRQAAAYSVHLPPHAYPAAADDVSRADIRRLTARFEDGRRHTPSTNRTSRHDPGQACSRPTAHGYALPYRPHIRARTGSG